MLNDNEILCLVSRGYIDKIFKSTIFKSEKNRLTFLPLDNFTKDYLEKKGFKTINLKKFSKNSFNNPYAVEFINRIKSKDIKDSSLLNSLCYKGINLIDLIDTEFLIFFLEKFIRQLDVSIKLISDFRPRKVIIATNSGNWASLFNLNFDAVLAESIKLVSNWKSIPVIDISSTIGEIKFDLLCIVRPYLKLARELISSINLSAKYFLKRERINDRRKGKVIFLNHSFSSNTILPVMAEIGKRQYLVTLLIQISGFPHLVRSEYLKFYRPWHYFFRISVFIEMCRAWFSLKGKLKRLRQSDLWSKIKYGRIEIGKLIRKIFFYFATTRLLSAVKFIEMADLMFGKENVKFVVTPEDRTLPNRAICALASTRNIPTLLIQRGVYGNHPLYKFPFLVDKVALEGEWVKKLLINMGHSASKFEITGQPAYDLLKEKYGKIDRSAIYSKYKIDMKAKIILYTSQPLVEGLSNRNNIMPKETIISHREEVREICHSLCNKKGIILLLKPHPNENDDLHYQIVKEIGAGNIKVISKRANTSELISIADLLITRHSTTGAEAIVLDKPLIIVNLLSIPDSFPYVDYGSALGVYRKENIWLAVESIFQDKQVNERLKEGRMRFIRDFAYKLDGKSSRRIAALIESMLKESEETVEN
ncbi:MAG: CDP-glycerol glycerophosphotransferase family protein [bacterium]